MSSKVRIRRAWWESCLARRREGRKVLIVPPGFSFRTVAHGLQVLVCGAVLLLGCTRDRETSPKLTQFAGTEAGACLTPQQGCSCDAPGKVVACGTVANSSVDRTTCTMGHRSCGTDGIWGPCRGTETRILDGTSIPRSTLALGTATQCEGNPCDPYCKYVDDSSDDMTGELPPGLCEEATGLALCPRCDDYDVPHRSTPYASLPSAWKTLPTTCETTPTGNGEGCSHDLTCNNGICDALRSPCYDLDPPGCSLSTKVDFTVGPPCISGSTYHIPICNRGPNRADSGTLVVAFYSNADSTDDCVTTSYSTTNQVGRLNFTLSSAAGRYIDPGACIDLNPASVSSVSVTPNLSAVRGVVVNYRRGIQECNYCNNWNVIDPAASCTGCTNLECSQICSATSITGTIRDPRGVNPIPGVVVYVPNETVEPFVDGVACDTCENLYSGAPITTTVTGADGTFTLGNVPSGTSFPLVFQTGRWRRQVTISSIAPCASATLPSGENSWLPSNKSEGDIPKIAILMGDADPIQCLLRRIGIDDSEFTGSSGSGRIHLYNHNGMQYPGSRPAYWGSNPLLDDSAKMDEYNAILAPCDYEHGDYPDYEDRSGPSYNGTPTPTLSASERANVKAYVNKGGRVFTTHWLSMDFVHLLYNPPPSPQPIMSPFSPDHGFSLEASSLGVGWTTSSTSAFNPTAPVVHLFGRNIETFCNNSEPLPPTFAPTETAYKYTIDTSTALGQTFADWANNVGASPDGTGTVRFNTWASHVSLVRSPAVRLAYTDMPTSSNFITFSGTPPSIVQQGCLSTSGDATYDCKVGGNKFWAGPHVALLYFDTPWGSPPEAQCGRIVVAQSHVTSHQCFMPSSRDRSRPSHGAACLDDSSGTECCSNSPPYTDDSVTFGSNPAPDCSCINLPGDWSKGCGTATTMTAQEKAFEFMIYTTTQCVGSSTPTPEPTPLQPQTFTRDYDAGCAQGEQVQWSYFFWQAAIPTGTSILFEAQTADTQDDLDAATKVRIGVADTTTTSWARDNDTVEQHLSDEDPPLTSRTWLRVSMTLYPDVTSTPALSDWRLTYDCVPNE